MYRTIATTFTLTCSIFSFYFYCYSADAGTLTKVSAPKNKDSALFSLFASSLPRLYINITNANCFSSHPTFAAACHLPPLALLLPLPAILLAPPRYDPLTPPLSLLAALLTLLTPCSASAAAANGAPGLNLSII